MQIEMQDSAGPPVLVIGATRIADRDALNAWLLHVNAVADALWPGEAVVATDSNGAANQPLRKPHPGSKFEILVPAILAGASPKEIVNKIGGGLTRKRVYAMTHYARKVGYLPPVSRKT